MNLTTRYLVGDVFERLRQLPDQSVDLVMSSPPFLALRSYLPEDHEHKSKEIGSEATPADFLDTLLDVVEECRRVLTPHGSLVFELGDTYSGSGGAGGDYNEGGAQDGAPKFSGSALSYRKTTQRNRELIGWPLEKSLTGIPTLFTWSLAYERNLLRPERETDQWRIRNVIVWARPNPPVGALADKMRPATSYLTVATMARDRWFDMDAVRTEPKDFGPRYSEITREIPGRATQITNKMGDDGQRIQSNPAGAPLLDYWWLDDQFDQDTWEISTQPYKGSHYATFPEELPRRVILSMCPEKVCTVCGEPSRRIVERESFGNATVKSRAGTNAPSLSVSTDVPDFAERRTLGWTDCGHDAWRAGVVLDPFAGSGTTLRMALGNGRSSIGIDIDERNADLPLDRVGPLYMDVER